MMIYKALFVGALLYGGVPFFLQAADDGPTHDGKKDALPHVVAVSPLFKGSSVSKTVSRRGRVHRMSVKSVDDETRFRTWWGCVLAGELGAMSKFRAFLNQSLDDKWIDFCEARLGALLDRHCGFPIGGVRKGPQSMQDQWALGYIFEAGYLAGGKDDDRSGAVEYYQKAADQGHKFACARMEQITSGAKDDIVAEWYAQNTGAGAGAGGHVAPVEGAGVGL